MGNPKDKHKRTRDDKTAAANDKTEHGSETKLVHGSEAPLNEGIKNGVEQVMEKINERKKKLPNIVETTERRTVSVDYQLSAEQIRKVAQDLSQLQIETVELDDEKKTVMKGFAERKQAKSASINKFARQIKDGTERRDHNCILVLDFKKKQKRYKDADSKKIVKVEPFSPGDEQLRFL